MRRLFAFILAAMMMLALTACGSEAAPETTAPVDTVPETTVAPTTQAPTETPTEPAAAFDPGWAGSEYEMRIPQPPFTQYKVEVSDHMHMITATDPEEIGQLTQDEVAAYCELLKELFDFTNIQVDGPFEDGYGEAMYGLGASTDDGLVVELQYGAGGGTSEDDPSFFILVVIP